VSIKLLRKRRKLEAVNSEGSGSVW